MATFAAPVPVLCPPLGHFCAALISKNLETLAAKLIMGIKTQFNSPLKASPPLKHFAHMLDSNKFRFEVTGATMLNKPWLLEPQFPHQ